MNRILKVSVFCILDIFSVGFAWVLAVALSRCDFAQCMSQWYLFAAGAVLACVLNALFGLYSKLLRYMDFTDALKMGVSGVCMILYFGGVSLFSAPYGVEWFIIASMLYMCMLYVGRFAVKIYVTITRSSRAAAEKKASVRVAVIGAGSAGSMLIREMKSTDKVNMTPVCVLDDDAHKVGQYINGVKVVGKISDVVWVSEKYRVEEIVLAIPSVSKKRTKEIVEECQKTGCKIKIAPGAYQIISGKVSVSDIRPVSIQDLLGREQVKINIEEIIGYIEGKVVMVTGGGGSIGSELCRQLAGHNPSELIIVDIYENNAYDIQQELIRKYPNLKLTVLIASVRDSKRVNNIFEKYKPRIVFHAAAHKHVPLMEQSPNEAVKNNVSGTFKVADAAGRNGVEKFILISTDKAVNPTNIMGASKRICEMIVQAMNSKYKTDYVAVRFGNVLGSNGSVIPLFMKQIAEGGPVTVTDKNIVRYFMTIPEAVSLVLQAGAYAKGGEIFVLDMGEQVRIYDLAEKMIKLSGLEPHKDIEIKIVGLRPGEKLFEERLMAEEGLQKTANDMISVGKPLIFDEENLFRKIQQLYVEAYNETDKMKQLVHELVTTYKIDERNG